MVEIKISDHLRELALQAINRMEDLGLDEISVKGASGIFVSREFKGGEGVTLLDILEINCSHPPIGYFVFYRKL